MKQKIFNKKKSLVVPGWHQEPAESQLISNFAPLWSKNKTKGFESWTKTCWF